MQILHIGFAGRAKQMSKTTPSHANEPTDDMTDVAVLGLGPVGAAACCLLAAEGLSVVGFERDTDVYPLPRAVGFDGEIVRAFQRIGLGDELCSILQAHRPGERAGFANSRREWLFGFEYPENGANGWRPMSMFHQPEVDSWLRARAAESEQVSLHLGTEVEGFESSETGVTLRVRDPQDGAVRSWRARYLIACDGAASATRHALGSTWKDLGYDRDWLVVDAIAREGHTLPLDTLQVCDPDRLVTLVIGKDPWRRWEFSLNPGETREEMLTDEKILSLIDPFTPRGTYEIRRRAVYQFHAATARPWSRGRVFLAGDAAHQMPPFLGQGMNSGIRDVNNLAWKLGHVLRGEAGASLLDTYEQERSPHAEALVGWAVSLGKLMEHIAQTELAEREGRDPPAMPAGSEGAGYGQGREAPPLQDGILLPHQVSAKGSTGYLFYQPKVRDRDGASFRLDEALGRGFALVGRDAEALELDATGREICSRRGIRCVTLHDLELVEGRFDPLFEHHSACLVRPDRHVFGHTDENLSVHALLAALDAAIPPP